MLHITDTEAHLLFSQRDLRDIKSWTDKTLSIWSHVEDDKLVDHLTQLMRLKAIEVHCCMRSEKEQQFLNVSLKLMSSYSMDETFQTLQARQSCKWFMVQQSKSFTKYIQ